MKTFGNFLWFVLIGWWYGLITWLGGAILCVTLVGIPLGIAQFRIAKLAFLPFKKTVTTDYPSHPKGNVVWMALGGAEATVGCAIVGAILCVTIIGIPFGKQFFKLTRLSALPYGATVTKN